MRTSLLATMTSFLVFMGCKDKVVTTPLDLNQHYPTSLGNEWEYVTTTSIARYDTLGFIYSDSVYVSDTVIIGIMAINDSVPGYTGLIRFESARKNSYPLPSTKETNWYLNTHDGLYMVAYKNPAINSFVQPKKNNRYTVSDLIKEMKIYSVQPGITEGVLKISADSIQYQRPPRKVLAYLLAMNSRWVELSNSDFYRERTITGTENIIYNGSPLYCYVVSSSYLGVNIIDHISTDFGLVKRDVIADSVQFMNENAEITGYGRYSSKSELKRVIIK